MGHRSSEPECLTAVPLFQLIHHGDARSMMSGLLGFVLGHWVAAAGTMSLLTAVFLVRETRHAEL
jgi:hypothetical protein